MTDKVVELTPKQLKRAVGQLKAEEQIKTLESALEVRRDQTFRQANQIRKLEQELLEARTAVDELVRTITRRDARIEAMEQMLENARVAK